MNTFKSMCQSKVKTKFKKKKETTKIYRRSERKGKGRKRKKPSQSALLMKPSFISGEVRVWSMPRNI